MRSEQWSQDLRGHGALAEGSLSGVQVGRCQPTGVKEVGGRDSLARTGLETGSVRRRKPGEDGIRK